MRRIVSTCVCILMGAALISSCNKDSVVLVYQPAPERPRRHFRPPAEGRTAAPKGRRATRGSDRRATASGKLPRSAPVKLASLLPAKLRGTPLHGRVDKLSLAQPLTHGNLTIYPVLSDEKPLAKPVLTIDQAFKRQKLTVTEEGSAQVPQIAVSKAAGEHIFVMTGEMFIGARQDRISKHDAILPSSKGRFELPVYCVEQGRWSGGNSFRSGNNVATQSLRKTAVRKKSQSEVWSKVSSKTSQVKAQTATQTMQATYQSALFKKKSPAYLKVFAKLPKRYPRSVGALVVINKAIVSFDVFVTHGLFTGLWPKLIKAFVLDAIDPHFKGSPYHHERSRAFFARLSAARFKKSKSPGMGEEFLIASPDITGSVLVAKNRLVHFALFPEKEEKIRSFVRARKVSAPADTNPDAGKDVPYAPPHKGYKGYKGRKGYKGYKGNKGNKGNKGYKGYKGYKLRRWKKRRWKKRRPTPKKGGKRWYKKLVPQPGK
jgi:hypothetical protein